MTHGTQPVGRFSGSLHGTRVSCAATVLLVLAILVWAGSPVRADQTRDQCEKCCKGKESDEYYFEQCRLKCFRAPNHCMGKEPAQPAQAEAPPPEREVTRQPPPAQPQARQPQPPQREPRQPRPQPPQFQWPNPLRLSPGKEREAAGAILTVNGIPPQHPNHGAALAGVQQVLMDFVRNNPRGGEMPTTALEAIIARFR